MTKGPIRVYGRGHLHFITFRCYRRLALLGSVRARKTVQILDAVRDCHGFALVGYVVMPEHVHLLIGEPRRDTPSASCAAVANSSATDSHFLVPEPNCYCSPLGTANWLPAVLLGGTQPSFEGPFWKK